MHLGIRLGLSIDEASPLILAELDLFILLDKIAWGAAARAEAVSASYSRHLVRTFELQMKSGECKLTVALEAIFLPDLAALAHLDDPMAANAGQGVPATAIAIEEGPAVKVGICMKAVGDTAVGDTW